MKQKRAAVMGGNGFIGHHLVNYLKKKGYFVRVVDIAFEEYDTTADEVLIYDLRDEEQAMKAIINGNFDEVYQLAADMGGMGFIHFNELDTLTHNVKINMNVLKAARLYDVKKYFYSSSVCVYPDMRQGAKRLKEEDVYPAMPDNQYGWEKLYSERIALQYAKDYKMDIRIARFENCYGPEGTWVGGREKVPAAICRKIANAGQVKTIDIWGDGTAVRNFIYIDDLVEAIYKLMHSGIESPVNIGTETNYSVNELVETIAKVADKEIKTKTVEGPIGVQSRNFSHDKIRSLGWKPKHTLLQGIKKTYPWIKKQIDQ